MAITAAPYGLRPVNTIGGRPYAGSTRLIKIGSAYGTNIFFGDIVALNSSGTITKVTATGADGTTNAFPAGVIGVFLGCTYSDPNLKYKVFKQYWPSGTVASDAYAYVIDDPNVLYQVQANGSLTQTAVGNNFCVVQTAGSTLTGDSAIALNASSQNTSTFLPFRVVEFVNGPFSAVGDAFTDVIVRFNFGIHSYESATGI